MLCVLKTTIFIILTLKKLITYDLLLVILDLSPLVVSLWSLKFNKNNHLLYANY
jgi:hypothetical protein